MLVLGNAKFGDHKTLRMEIFLDIRTKAQDGIINLINEVIKETPDDVDVGHGFFKSPTTGQWTHWVVEKPKDRGLSILYPTTTELKKILNTTIDAMNGAVRTTVMNQYS